MEKIRLQKFLAEAGIASRRKAEELISQGKVYINGEKATIGDKVDIAIDNVEINGKKVKLEEKKVYILLNKPVGYVTTVKDQFNRNTVMDLINIKERVVPVGRLDMYTSGALLLSNDGDFVYHITHPKHEIEKTYIALVNGRVDENQTNKLRKGIAIDNYVTKPAKVRVIDYNKNTDYTTVEITIHEGKNRQVRKMLDAIGKKTIELKRIKIGDLNINNLESGEWRFLKKQEVDKLVK